MPALDHKDISYYNIAPSLLQQLNPAYHGAPHFITNEKVHAHHRLLCTTKLDGLPHTGKRGLYEL